MAIRPVLLRREALPGRDAQVCKGFRHGLPNTGRPDLVTRPHVAVAVLRDDA
jgi:hypothetical protein